MIKTYHETKRYKDQSNYFWFKNESYKPETYYILFDNMSSSPQLSLDKTNWFTPTSQITVQPGHKLYMRCSAGYFFSEGEEWSIYNNGLTGKWSAGGPLASLIDYTDQENVTAIPAYCFNQLFWGLRESLVDVSEVDFGNITEVGDYGMAHMFEGCMFKSGSVDLSGLTQLGDFSMEQCFRESGIKTADLSGVTVLGNNALSLSFYSTHYMNEIHAPNVQTWDVYKTSSWLYAAGASVTGTKTFYAPTGVTIPTNDYSGIPTGWTRVDY